MNNKLFFLSVLSLIATIHIADCQTSKSKAKPITSSIDWYFKPEFKKGETLGNVYSRAIAYSGNDFADIVQRVSGSSTYTVVDDDSDKPVFTEADLYDG